MASQFAPEILFTNPTMASQMVRLSDLDAAQRNKQQLIALSTLAANADRQARERELGDRNAIQMAALMNQNQQHNDEIAARERMLASQLAGSKDLLTTQLDAQERLAKLNPWGKGGVDAFLGAAQINNSINQSNSEGEAEANQLNAALNLIDQDIASKRSQYHPSVWKRLGRGVLGGLDIIDNNDEADQNFELGLQSERNQRLAQLMANAKKSYFDPTRNQFIGISRTGIGIPGVGGTTTPAPGGVAPTNPMSAPMGGNGQYVPPPTFTPIPGASLFVPPSGAIDNPRFTPSYWLDRPQDSLDRIQQDYMNGSIDAATAIARRQALGL